jgi:hypothetical protein
MNRTSSTASPSQKAYTIDQFIGLYPMCRAKFYQLVNRGEILATKCGWRTYILVKDAEAWAATLPKYQPAG